MYWGCHVKTYVHEFLHIWKVLCQKCFQYQSIYLKCMLQALHVCMCERVQERGVVQMWEDE